MLFRWPLRATGRCRPGPEGGRMNTLFTKKRQKKMRRYISTALLRATHAAQQQQQQQKLLSMTLCTRHVSSSSVVNAASSSYSSSSTGGDEESSFRKMLKRDDFFALPDFVAKCNDNNAKVNVREVVKALRENSVKHPRDLLRVNREDLLRTIGDDKKDLAKALRENLGVWTEEDEQEARSEERKKMRAQRRMEREKQKREEKEKLAAAAMREEMILEKKRMKEAERQQRKEEEREEAVKLKVHILKENDENENSSSNSALTSPSSSSLESPVKKRTLKRMKRRMRTGVICDGVRVTQRNSQLENYRLSFSDLPDSLQKELTKMKTFLTRRRLGPQEAPIAIVTANKYEEHIRGICGWLVKEKEYKVKDLKSLSVLFPSMKANAADVTFDYLQYLTVERGISANYELLITRSCIAAAKFMYGAKSKFQPGEDALPYQDIPLIKELRRLAKDAKSRASKSPLMSNEKLKWLDWGDYLQVCDMLKDEMALNYVTSHKRSQSAIAWSMQRYLIFAILSCVPDRQRTLRELRIGKTLIREEKEDEKEARWIIKHGPNDYKTGKDYGVRPPLVIAPELYPHLENFVNNYRQHLNPQHDFLFSRKNGQPFNDAGIYRLFTSTSMRLTGKRTNPHLVRDMIVTHLRRTNASEKELEALAIYMGHSLAMQKGSYDRRTISEKVEPAVSLLSSLNASFRSSSF